MGIVKVKDSALRQAAEDGMDAFLKVFREATMDAIGGELNALSMKMLNGDQLTLLAYCILAEEVMDGGFVQLIHNGYGGFIFTNPFAKAIGQWGVDGLPALIRKGEKLYRKYRDQIEVDCTDEEFMALFERFPEFDDLDDRFIDGEEGWTNDVAIYVDSHLDRFADIEEDSATSEGNGQGN